MPIEQLLEQIHLAAYEGMARPSVRGIRRDVLRFVRGAMPTQDRLQPYTSHVLDITRAAAAGLVVLLHARIYAVGNVPDRIWDQLIYAVTNCGTPAVFWFFVISGYLVGGGVIAEVVRSGQFDFRRYLINRLARLCIVLLPALLLGGILDGIRVATWGLNAHAGYETAASYSAATLLGNVLFLQTLLVPTFGSNAALWSLANEFWYYLLFPLLLAPFMVRRPRAVRVPLFAAGLLLAAVLFRLNGSLVWLFTLWCLGALTRFLPISGMKSPVLAWSIAVGCMVASPHLHPWIGMLATLMVGVTFANAILSTHRCATLPSARWAVAVKLLSGFSFSLYLIHLPLQHLVVTQIGQNADPFLRLAARSLGAPAVILTLAGLSYAAAFAFSLATEAHTAKLRRWLSARVPRSRALPG